MSQAEITLYNAGRDNWETVARYGADRALDILTSGHLVSGELLAALDRLGPTLSRKWLLRGYSSVAAGEAT